jgi:hypothetical protein
MPTAPQFRDWGRTCRTTARSLQRQQADWTSHWGSDVMVGGRLTTTVDDAVYLLANDQLVAARLLDQTAAECDQHAAVCDQWHRDIETYRRLAAAWDQLAASAEEGDEPLGRRPTYPAKPNWWVD